MEPRMEGAGLEYCFSLQCGGASGAFHGACSGETAVVHRKHKGYLLCPLCHLQVKLSHLMCPVFRGHPSSASNSSIVQ